MATFTVCIPSYNAERIIGETIQSLLRQTFQDWDCIVVDDASTDRTADVVRGFSDPRIRFIPNDQNLGCAGNFQRCRDLATGKYIYFLANDDILAPTALERCYDAFQLAEDVAVVTRPYYWFRGSDHDVAIRYTKPLDPTKDRVITIDDDNDDLRALFETLGQVSALAYRNDALETPFSPHVWTTHIQAFLGTLKQHRGVFLHDYPVAIRTESSQARNISSIYDPSPLWTWVTMMRTVFAGPRWTRQRKLGIDNIGRHPEGLVQLRCHSTFRNFLRESWLYLLYRPRNAWLPAYWIFFLGCLVTPRKLLRKMVDRYIGIYTRSDRAGIVTISRSKTAS